MNDWVESPRAERFEFAKKGDTLTGKLVAIEPVEVEGEVKQQVMVNTIGNGELKLYTFLMMADMRGRIPVENIGKGIRIAYQGDSDTVGHNKGNAMKLFNIAFKELPKAATS
jgi:hypothetical protein